MVVIPAKIIISVPHSGTRTLVKHLGFKTHQHFLYDRQTTHPDASKVHVPIRHPLDIAESWARRGKNLDQLIKRFEFMFMYLSKNQPNLYKIEDIQRLAGLDDADVNRAKVAAIQEYQARVLSEVMEPNAEFYQAFYGLEFTT